MKDTRLRNRMMKDTRQGPDEEYPVTEPDEDTGPVRVLTGCGDIFVNMFFQEPFEAIFVNSPKVILV